MLLKTGKEHSALFFFFSYLLISVQDQRGVLEFVSATLRCAVVVLLEIFRGASSHSAQAVKVRYSVLQA